MNYIMDSYDTRKRTSRGLSVCECGWQKSGGGHSYGPAIRDYYVIHYIVSGKGIYRCDGREYRLEKNQGFLILPGRSTFYKADDEEPWEYYWAGFQGSEVNELLPMMRLGGKNLIFSYDRDDTVKELLKSLYYSSRNYSSREYAMLGYLYLFFSAIISQTPDPRKPAEEYIDRVLQYMQENISRPITAGQIARETGIERSYLYRLFQRAFHCSVCEYLLNLRLEKACELLVNTNVSVTQIALSHGFGTLAHFSRRFKQKYGISPRDYRKTE